MDAQTFNAACIEAAGLLDRADKGLAGLDGLTDTQAVKVGKASATIEQVRRQIDCQVR
jgi:hypothetical protein